MILLMKLKRKKKSPVDVTHSLTLGPAARDAQTRRNANLKLKKSNSCITSTIYFLNNPHSGAPKAQHAELSEQRALQI